jgi:hypothetical protein
VLIVCLRVPYDYQNERLFPSSTWTNWCCNGNVLCFLSGRNWSHEYYLDELGFKRIKARHGIFLRCSNSLSCLKNSVGKALFSNKWLPPFRYHRLRFVPRPRCFFCGNHENVLFSKVRKLTESSCIGNGLTNTACPTSVSLWSLYSQWFIPLAIIQNIRFLVWDSCVDSILA